MRKGRGLLNRRVHRSARGINTKVVGEVTYEASFCGFDWMCAFAVNTIAGCGLFSAIPSVRLVCTDKDDLEHPSTFCVNPYACQGEPGAKLLCSWVVESDLEHEDEYDTEGSAVHNGPCEVGDEDREYPPCACVGNGVCQGGGGGEGGGGDGGTVPTTSDGSSSTSSGSSTSSEGGDSGDSTTGGGRE